MGAWNILLRGKWGEKPQGDTQAGSTAQKMGKTGKEIEELIGVRQNRASEIWTAYQREGEASLERKKYGRKLGSHMVLNAEEQSDIQKAIEKAGGPACCGRWSERGSTSKSSSTRP